uniref:AlNc14C284G10161 protein n=1 Tax=Albugo laibachii Nc14 TaxID=890382 RepID=F0WV16_9STRA|nr:AlNc14C284G10161 [Albugo laibachii Nc14]|eukprot:CCA25252.1 AlNc14C284G10161 [Albugo laibachii Nc14]
MDGAIIQWIGKKQTGESLSTMEAEFTSASHVGRELLGLRELVREIGFLVSEPMTMMMDNQAAIKHLESDYSIANAKHVNIRVKFYRDFANRGIVRPAYVKLRIMMTDLLTRALPAPRLAETASVFWAALSGRSQARVGRGGV